MGAQNIQIGIQPTGWTNDDFPEIGDETPYQQILDETAQTGYEGGSTGHNYPTHVPSLRYALEHKKLKITSTWVGTRFTVPDQFDATLSYVKGQIAFLRAIGARDIVVAELAGAVNQVRDKAVFDDRPRFNEAQWFLLVRGLNEAGKLARDAQMKLSFHPHLGTGVQNEDEVEELLKRTDPDQVFLCLDTAHVYCAGINPLELARRHVKRIKHVHLKNARQAVLDDTRARKGSFFEAILNGIFTVPGDPEGCIAFAPILRELVTNQYEGWIVVEAEQSPYKKPPIEYARMARALIRADIGI
jgi:inosose dehydratase